MSNNQEKEREVHYEEGATPLFNAIEETEWRDALDIAEAYPEQVRTWVKSNGTENTTFEWSMWRRLPIHEACRRQAPVWLISALLSIYPKSAYMETKFDALPLHVAVESGCSPEVVNLLIVANWHAIITPDQSGRIPTDILDTSELLRLEEHRVIHESLKRCHQAYTYMQKVAQDERTALKMKHKAAMNTVTKRHQDELKREQEKQDELREQIRALESRLEDRKETERAKDHQIKKFQSEKQRWLDDLKKLEEVAEMFETDLSKEKETVDALMKIVDQKEKEIHKRDDKIEVLSNDLRNVTAMHEDEIMGSLIETEESMRVMVSKQIALQKHLAGHANGLKALLAARGIDMLDPVPVEEEEEETKQPHPEATINEGDAADAVVAAAMVALQKPTAAGMV